MGEVINPVEFTAVVATTAVGRTKRSLSLAVISIALRLKKIKAGLIAKAAIAGALISVY